MSGTVATYQGFPCQAVRFRRSRGWRADTSSVLLFAKDFPQGFEFVTPEPQGLERLQLRTLSPPDLSAIRGGPGLAARRRRLPAQRRLNYAGALVLAEVDRQGREFVVAVDPLFCVSVEIVRRNKDGSVAVASAKLVDVRFFSSLGFLRRWSFNRTDADGEYSKDSLKPSGEPFTLAEIAGEVSGDLFLTPALVRTPPSWAESRPETEFPRFGSSTAALVRLQQEHGSEDLCLNLDNSIALWEAGEGRVGYAPKGEGAGNAQPIPPQFRLYLGGSGQTKGVEATYPPDYVVVVGGLRVATVRMDHLDPVLLIENTVVPLTEETVRKLTGDRFGLEWLAVFVLAPQAYQNQVGLDSAVVDLLRTQAYRLWRIPGVETEAPAEAPQAGRDPQGAFAIPGPNAHLLPLRARAETVAGKRLPVRVDRYGFASAHRAMAGGRAQALIADLQSRLRKLKRQIKEFARRAGEPDPFTSPEVFFLFQDKYVSPRLLYQFSGAGRHAVSYEQFQSLIARARLIDRIAELTPTHASQFEQAFGELSKIDQEQGGTLGSLWDLAKEIVAFEKEVAESRSPLETPDAEAKDRADELRRRVRDELLEIDRQREAQALRTRLGGAVKSADQTAVFVRNLPLQLDAGAHVVSPELGVIRTSDLSGHVKEEGVPVAEATSFVPRSPVVEFGAVLRPKVTESGGRPVTGALAPDSTTKIPSALTDTESYYTAAFRRTAPGRAEPVELSAVPKGQGVPLVRPDLVELIPLGGAGNKGALDGTAQALAIGIFKRPERVAQGKQSFARPWPVNTDGVVSAVEIVLRPRGKGFVTSVYTGSESPVSDGGVGRTRVRVKRGGPSDAAEREGLTP